MNLAKTFEPKDIESRWYAQWEEKGYFAAGVDENAPNNFCILMPPPNVTGTLHMGHGFNQSLMDALTRYHRMKGDNTLWQPGTDHAGIATQIVVERQLDKEKISRHDLGREKFLETVWQWKNYSGGTITNQMRRLGASPDWSRERFTMDSSMNEIVVKIFVELYKKNLVYRGKRLVNWDPVLKTAVSDLEVVQEEEKGFLWHIRYDLSDGSGHLVVATTRPETLFGDAAVMVHPDDERYQSLIGKSVKLPLTELEIPIIADEYVDREFGTGCVKVTPAHDFNDYAVGLRHHLPMRNIFTLDAQTNENVPEKYQNLDRFAAREKVLNDLKNNEQLLKTEPHLLKIPRGDRTHSVIEPMLTNQWFVAMSQKDDSGKSIAERALDVVQNGDIRFYPETWVNTYNQWLLNIQDWCISRQLWWGHQIPAWYGENGEIFVAHNEEEAKEEAKKAGYNGTLTRDEDVLDTWFSSALWPFSTLDWTGDFEKDKNNRILQQYLPSSVLVTGFDIIFFWVARMVMMTLFATDKIPFHHVYVHGLIRDSKGQKMSKSKGNVLDPIDLIDGIDLESLIQKRTFGLMNPEQEKEIIQNTKEEFPNGIPAFGTDALRFTFLSLASPGRDIKFDLKRCEGYKNFCNKLWNATRFVLMNLGENKISPNIQKEKCSFADLWILNSFNLVIKEMDIHFKNYRFDLLANALYKFVWDEFCDWYLEIAKIELNHSNQENVENTKSVLFFVLENILRLAHPLIPFISEELWQNLIVLSNQKDKKETLMLMPWPKENYAFENADSVQKMERLKAFISATRILRGEMKLSPAQKVPLMIGIQNETIKNEIAEFILIWCVLGKLSEIKIVEKIPENAAAPVSIVFDCSLMLEIEIDKTAEKKRLEKEIESIQKQIQIAENKLNNQNFISRAPANIVQQEKERFSKFSQDLEKLQILFQNLK